MRETAKQPASAVKAKTESQTLVAKNENRQAVFITNEGAKPVNLALGPTAVKEKGPWLSAEGGNITIDGAVYSGIITVVTKEGESNVGFSEV
jgi:hypothetical protein